MVKLTFYRVPSRAAVSRSKRRRIVEFISPKPPARRRFLSAAAVFTGSVEALDFTMRKTQTHFRQAAMLHAIAIAAMASFWQL